MKLIHCDMPDAWVNGIKFRQTFYATNEVCQIFKARNVNEMQKVIVGCGLFEAFGSKLDPIMRATLSEHFFYSGYEIWIGQTYYKLVLICRADEGPRVCTYRWYALQP